MDEWNWFSTPVRARYYFERSAQDCVVKEVFYLGFRIDRGRGEVVYLTEDGIQINVSERLRHKAMVVG